VSSFQHRLGSGEMYVMYSFCFRPQHMKILITADLHCREHWFRWLIEQAPESEATTSLVENLRYRATLPEGPDVELHEVEPTQTAMKLEEAVTDGSAVDSVVWTKY